MVFIFIFIVSISSKESNHSFARFLRCHGCFSFIFDSELSRHEPMMRPASQEVKRNWDKAIVSPLFREAEERLLCGLLELDAGDGGEFLNHPYGPI
jgi:hypothetical protein